MNPQFKSKLFVFTFVCASVCFLVCFILSCATNYVALCDGSQVDKCALELAQLPPSLQKHVLYYRHYNIPYSQNLCDLIQYYVNHICTFELERLPPRLQSDVLFYRHHNMALPQDLYNEIEYLVTHDYELAPDPEYQKLKNSIKVRSIMVVVVLVCIYFLKP